MESPLISYLQKVRQIPEGEQELILSSFEKMSFQKGKNLIKAGRPIQHLFFICKGIVKILIPNVEGKELTYFFLNEHQFVTLLNRFSLDISAEQSIQAVTDTEVLAIDKNQLNALISRLPYFKDLLEHIVQQSMLEKIISRNAYKGYDSGRRYSIFLEREREIAYKIPTSDIASYLDITPQSLTRMRKNIH